MPRGPRVPDPVGQEEEKMSIFPDREAAFEQKFVHDEEVAFLVRMARERRFGLWAAGRMGQDEEAAAAYARSLVKGALDGKTDAELLAEVQRDLAARGVSASPTELQQAMLQAETGARTQVMGADPSALDRR
ncbi:hypothetical protein M673_19125 (plasmid) [Aureimonas sp. AU20]|nr:hypothetical protein M673_19125 [Aureimonas sp. AU20]